VRAFLTVLAAVALPFALAFAVYASAAGSLGTETTPTAITTRAIAAPVATTTEPAKKKPKQNRPGATTTTTTDDDDVSGNCDEAEHANDPECVSGGDDSDDSDNSGKGSENSGSGGGDD